MGRILSYITLGAAGAMSSASAAVDLKALDDVKTDVASVGGVLVAIAVLALGAGLVYKFIWSKK